MTRSVNRILSLALSAVMAYGCFAVSASAVTGKYGDVNNDGSINSSDALTVLRYSVGGTTIDSESFIRADVTADGKVNSSDALDILRYSVGSLDRFKADVSIPASKNEILSVYATAVSKARAGRPSYKIDMNSETKDVDAELSGFASSALKEAQKAEFVAQMKEESEGTQRYNTTVKQGSTNSVNNLPVECTLTDASALKSITCAKNEAGNYLINIKFKDETNPKTSTSTLVKVLGVPDYDSTLAGLKDDSSVDGITATVDSLSMKYSGCGISCEINPVTGEFISLDWNTSLKTVTKITALALTVEMSMTLNTTSSYSDFGY